MATSPDEPLRDFDSAAGPLSGALAAIERARAAFERAEREGRVPENSREAVRVELTFNSNAIEGSTLTLRETQLVLEGHAPAGNKSMRELYEARNHDRALRSIEAWVADTATAGVTEERLLAVHAMLMTDIDAAHAGRFRTGRVLIKGTRFVPPGPHHFGVLLPQLIDLASRVSGSTVLRAAELHYNLVAVHPFNDGNGRTARLMMNHLLMSRGYPCTVVEVDRRAEYLLALEAANVGNVQPFAEFIAGCVQRSIDRLVG